MSRSMVSGIVWRKQIVNRLLTAHTEAYLRTRKETKFDRYDFDSLSNKFVSKLVIRAS
jgi:hypothetical protein